ncbi:MAG: hypothetical protein ACM34H_06775 [Deltaproteobacteria bacterium]
MKCPKCSYIGFDYNLSCPKCNKDISAEQEKLHIPAFRPDPPFLLATLTGEANESQVSVTATGSQISLEKEVDISLDDSSLLDSGEVVAEDSSELNLDSEELSLDDTTSLSLDTDQVQAEVAESLQKSRTGKDRAGTAELKLVPEADLGDLDLGEENEEELSLDSLEKGKGAAPAQAATDSDWDITLDLDSEEVSSERAKDGLLTSASAPSLEPLDLKSERAQGKKEIELSLDDLKINDTGELELGLEDKSSGDLDKLLEMDELRLDEIPLTEIPAKTKREARVVNAVAPKNKETQSSSDDEISLDLDSLELELEMEDAKPQR